LYNIFSAQCEYFSDVKTLFAKEKLFLIAQKLLCRHIKNTFEDIKNASMAIIHYMEFLTI